MKKIIAIIAALSLLAVPVVAQSSEQPPAGTVMVVAGIYDGVGWVPLQEAIVIPPLACDPL